MDLPVSVATNQNGVGYMAKPEVIFDVLGDQTKLSSEDLASLTAIPEDVDQYSSEPYHYYCDPYYEACHGNEDGYYNPYVYEKSNVHTIVWTALW